MMDDPAISIHSFNISEAGKTRSADLTEIITENYRPEVHDGITKNKNYIYRYGDYYLHIILYIYYIVMINLNIYFKYIVRMSEIIRHYIISIIFSFENDALTFTQNSNHCYEHEVDDFYLKLQGGIRKMTIFKPVPNKALKFKELVSCIYDIQYDKY
jgi:hypothetical protein